MVRRQRCVSCWELFTPNYRNRTKVSARQRVCSDCGAIIGHRLADQRYRASPAAPRRSRDPARAPSGAAPDTAPAPVSERLGDVVPDTDRARQMHAYLAAIAALVDAPACCTARGPVQPLPIGPGAKRAGLAT